MGPPSDNLELDPLAELHLDNRLCINIQLQFFLCNKTDQTIYLVVRWRRFIFLICICHVTTSRSRRSNVANRSVFVDNAITDFRRCDLTPARRSWKQVGSSCRGSDRDSRASSLSLFSRHPAILRSPVETKIENVKVNSTVNSTFIDHSQGCSTLGAAAGKTYTAQLALKN